MGLILFDIDGTIFDAEKFGRLTRTEFIGILKIDEEELMRAIADYYAALETRTDFNPREIVVHISKRYNVDPLFLDKIFWEEKRHYKEALYPEVVSVLKRLSEDNALGIFSQGFEEFQRHKLEAAGIKDFFAEEYIFVYKRKLSEDAISALPKEATVVENNHDVAIKLSDYVDVIWTNRRTEDNDLEVRTIHSLEELLTIL